VPGEITSVTADAAYDTHEFYEAARRRKAAVVVAPIASPIATDRGRAMPSVRFTRLKPRRASVSRAGSHS